MKASPLFAAATALAASCIAAAAPDPNRIRDLDPRDNDTLLKPRGNLEFFAATDVILGLGGDLRGHRGYAGSLGLYVMPERATRDDWRTKWGISGTAFGTHANGTLNGLATDENLGGAMILLEYGAMHDLGNRWEAGVMLGLGSGLFYGTMNDGAASHRKGNWDWVVQIKPTVAYKITPTVHAFLAYRLAYMAPFYDTELLGRHTTKIAYNALELGVTLRF